MSTAAIVLAAGSSRRLGRIKQLLPLGGKPLLAWPLAAAQQAGLAPIVLVLGYRAEEIAAVVDLTGIEMVVNARHLEGMSTSLQCAIAALGSDVDAVIVLTGDQPLVDAALLRSLLEAAASSELSIVATDHGAFQGVPMLLKRQIWPRVAEISGDQGARALLRRYPEEVLLVASHNADSALDVDSEEEYQAVLARMR